MELNIANFDFFLTSIMKCVVLAKFINFFSALYYDMWL